MILIQNSTLLTITRGTYFHCDILLSHGKIAALGPGIAAPPGCRAIDAHGGVVTPGLIDAHCHTALEEEGIGPAGDDVNERTRPTTPGLRPIDGMNPEDIGLKDAIKGGVTTIGVPPGSANIVGGHLSVLKTHGGTIDSMVIREFAGLKAAFGENPKRGYGSRHMMPSTRMGTAAVLRELLIRANSYSKKANPAEAGERDLDMESVLPVLRGEVPLRAHAHRADDILTAVRIADEFGLKLVIEHGMESYKVAEELRKRSIPVAMGPLLVAKYKRELTQAGADCAAKAYAAGITLALITDHSVFPIEFLRACAAVAMREGLPEHAAFAAITINPARILGVADRVGSLEAGKDADIVLFDGHPLDFRTHVNLVTVNGEVVYER
jgi:imidazolonepropionase-like amidohydrolase